MFPHVPSCWLNCNPSILNPQISTNTIQFLPEKIGERDYTSTLTEDNDRTKHLWEVLPTSFTRRPSKEASATHRVNLFSNYAEKKGHNAGVTPSKQNMSPMGSEKEGSGSEQKDEVDERKSSAPENMKPMKSARSKGGYLHAIIIKFGDPIPLGHSEGTLENPIIRKANTLKKTRRNLYKLGCILSVYPIVTKNQLSSMLQCSMSDYGLTDCLPLLAYSYSEGPYRNLWIKFGVDPTRDLRYRFHSLLQWRQYPPTMDVICKKGFDHIGLEKARFSYIDLDTYTVKPIPRFQLIYCV